jgi:hypothetical protein
MTPREKEKIQRDIHLTFEFTRYLVDHPELLDRIPDGAQIEFVEEGCPIPESRVNPEGAPICYVGLAHVFHLPEAAA